jgi:MYXO-CTERM domain-containing protein
MWAGAVCAMASRGSSAVVWGMAAVALLTAGLMRRRGWR